MQSRGSVFRKIYFLFFACVLFALAQNSFADGKRFPQKIQWQDDPNAYEYKVEVRPVDNHSKTSVFETSENFVNLSLAPGKYEYRVTAVDFLGREAASSDWTDFEIIKAMVPAITKTEEKVVAPETADGKLNIEVDVSSITEESKVELVNAETKETVPGELKVTADENGVKASNAEFPVVEPGEWSLKVTNPSGLTSVSEPVAIISEEMHQEELRKEEEARLEAERLEVERIAEEKRLEEERLEAERLEAERIAEEERLAEEARIAEEKRLAEEARLARKNRPAKDNNIFAKAGFAISPYDGEILESESMAPIVFAEWTSFPLKSKSKKHKAGYALSLAYSQSEESYNYADMTKQYVFVSADFVYKKVMQGDFLFAQLKAGAMSFLMNQTVDFADEYASSEMDSSVSKAFGYAGLQSGFSFVGVIAKHFAFEIGIDYDHVFVEGHPTGFVIPFAGFGIRW